MNDFGLMGTSLGMHQFKILNAHKSVFLKIRWLVVPQTEIDDFRQIVEHLFLSIPLRMT